MTNEVVTAKAFDAALMSSIRDLFFHVDADPMGGARLYLESAGGSLTLKAAVERSGEITALPDNAGRVTAASKYIGDVLASAADDVRTFLGAQGGRVVSGESVTANVFRVIDAAAGAKSSGNIVTSQLEHPCTYSATQYHAAQRGMAWRVAKVKPGTGELSVDSVLEHVDDETAVVVLVHASNVIGTRIDAPAIVSAIHERNPETLILLDGTQHAPHGPLDIAPLGVDAYFFAPYKTFCTVGTCFVWLSERMAAVEHARLAGTPVATWNLGTRDPAAHAAWSAVTNYLEWLGGEVDSKVSGRRDRIVAAMTAIEAHEMALSQQVIDGLAANSKVTLYGVPAADDRRDAVFAFSVDGHSSAEVVALLAEQGIAVHERKHDPYCGHILKAIGAPNLTRMSLAHYNTPDDVDRFLNVLERI